jgi:hypothetical protein
MDEQEVININFLSKEEKEKIKFLKESILIAKDKMKTEIWPLVLLKKCSSTKKIYPPLKK